MSLVTGALTHVAMEALTIVIGPLVEDARDALSDAAQDAIRSKVAGKMSIEEWANIVSQGADMVKERVINESNLQFVGGKLKLAVVEKNLKKVTVSFQLYFIDELEKWQIATAETDIPISKFTDDALNELRTSGEILFEVE